MITSITGFEVHVGNWFGGLIRFLLLLYILLYYGLVLSSKTTNNFYIHFQFMSNIKSCNLDDDNNDDDDDVGERVF
jgi:hypothetical protein